MPSKRGFQLLISLLLCSVSISVGFPAYVVQQYWYASSALCTGAPSFVNVYAVDTCFQQTSDTYVYYTYTNTSSQTFTVTLKTYSSAGCSSNSLISTSTGSYSSVCSLTGSGQTTTSSYLHFNSVPDLSDYPGPQRTYYSSSDCSGSPTNFYWNSNTMCAAVDSDWSTNAQCTSDGSQIEYRTWTNNNTNCFGTPSTTQYIDAITQCVAVYANLYMTESCTDTVSVNTAAACFPKYETVILADGTTKTLQEVQVGDKILAAREKPTLGALSDKQEFEYLFSEVIAVPHRESEMGNRMAEFVALWVVSEPGPVHDVLHLTPSHLIWASCAGDESTAYKLVEAASVTKGCYIIRVEDTGSESVTSSSVKVMSASLVRAPGMYSVVVADAEYICVNRIVVSPFASNHVFPNAAYNVLRLLHKYLPTAVYKSMTSVDEGNADNNMVLTNLVKTALRSAEQLSELLVPFLIL